MKTSDEVRAEGYRGKKAGNTLGSPRQIYAGPGWFAGAPYTFIPLWPWRKDEDTADGEVILPPPPLHLSISPPIHSILPPPRAKGSCRILYDMHRKLIDGYYVPLRRAYHATAKILSLRILRFYRVISQRKKLPRPRFAAVVVVVPRSAIIFGSLDGRPFSENPPGGRLSRSVTSESERY